MSNIEIASSFIQGAPPGEIADVVADVKALTADEQPDLVDRLVPAFQQYNEDQLTTVPFGGREAIVSAFNRLPDGRYYDSQAGKAFEFDHITRKVTGSQPYTIDSENLEFANSLAHAYAAHANEHFPHYSLGVWPSEDGATIALVANKYSPSNFWNGRYRSIYHVSSSGSVSGQIIVNVHYYEDGNVSLDTSKPVTVDSSSGNNPANIVRALAAAERAQQAETAAGFSSLAEGAFKSLRRQLPITRQRVDWDKVGGYRLGQDIGGRR